MKYQIVVSWMETAVCKVEASSLEEAKELVDGEPDKYVPEHGDYVDESMRIDDDCTKEMNDE